MDQLNVLSASTADPVLAVVLARTCASPAVAAAAAQRYRDWRAATRSIDETVDGLLDRYPWMRIGCPDEHPTAEHAARAIVFGCIEAERAGMLEIPC